MSFRAAWILPLLGACASGVELSASFSGEDNPSSNPQSPKPRVEFGTIDWERDFPSALTEAASTEKPVLLVFQEVPG